MVTIVKYYVNDKHVGDSLYLTPAIALEQGYKWIGNNPFKAFLAYPKGSSRGCWNGRHTDQDSSQYQHKLSLFNQMFGIKE